MGCGVGVAGDVEQAFAFLEKYPGCRGRGGGGAGAPGGAGPPPPPPHGPADVFSLFDKGVASIVANTSCGVDDPAAFEAFTQEFSKVASVVADELQRMNPERSRSEIDMVVGFRMAQLEMKTTSQVKKDGCNAPDVRASRALFNIGRRLAFIEGERREYNH